ncbi:MAG TPA: DUF3592 domain-containing protein [Allosphingosinicella sp.]|jgi:hypothetical protein
MMSRNTKIVIGLLVVLALFLGWLAYTAMAQKAAQTAEATATVVDAERERKRGDDDTIVTLSYEAGGAPAQARARIDGVRMGEYPAGKQVRICYDPSDRSSVRVTDEPCGG